MQGPGKHLICVFVFPLEEQQSIKTAAAIAGNCNYITKSDLEHMGFNKSSPWHWAGSLPQKEGLMPLVRWWMAPSEIVITQ